MAYTIDKYVEEKEAEKKEEGKSTNEDLDKRLFEP